MPNPDAELETILTFSDNLKVIHCPEMSVVDVEHTLTLKTCFVCPQNVKKNSSAVC
jgi:hypothetical protein